MRKIYVGFAFSHHKHSQGGYHHIREYLKYDKIIDAQWEKEFLERVSGNLLFRIIRRLYLLVLGQGTPLTVIRCILISLLRGNQVFHFIYAENSYKWLHRFKNRSNKIACTFHQPASFFYSNQFWLTVLKRIDIVFILAQKEISEFEKLTGKKNVYYVPHGVNCDFFNLDPTVAREETVLMVGNWLRNFNLAQRVSKTLNNVRPSIKISYVGSPSNYKYFEGMNVNCFTGLTDYELRNLYQSSRVVFFPLLQYTANNALLEAASCGCSIVIATESNNIDDSYFAKEMVRYFNGVTDDLVVLIIKELSMESDETQRSLNAYVRQNYHWEIVANKVDRILCAGISY